MKIESEEWRDEKYTVDLPGVIREVLANHSGID